MMITKHKFLKNVSYVLVFCLSLLILFASVTENISGGTDKSSKEIQSSRCAFFSKSNSLKYKIVEKESNGLSSVKAIFIFSLTVSEFLDDGLCKLKLQPERFTVQRKINKKKVNKLLEKAKGVLEKSKLEGLRKVKNKEYKDKDIEASNVTFDISSEVSDLPNNIHSKQKQLLEYFLPLFLSTYDLNKIKKGERGTHFDMIISRMRIGNTVLGKLNKKNVRNVSLKRSAEYKDSKFKPWTGTISIDVENHLLKSSNIKKIIKRNEEQNEGDLAEMLNENITTRLRVKLME